MRYDPPPEPESGSAASGSLRTTFVREAIVKYRGRGLKAHSPLREPFHAVSLTRRLVRDEAREHFVALYLDDEGGQSRIARIAGPGETFAEACICGQGTYPVTAEVLDPAHHVFRIKTLE